MKIANLKVLPRLTLLQKISRSGEKLKKPHSFAILRGLKGIRGDKEFFQKSGWNIFVTFHVLPNCKVTKN